MASGAAYDATVGGNATKSARASAAVVSGAGAASAPTGSVAGSSEAAAATSAAHDPTAVIT